MDYDSRGREVKENGFSEQEMNVEQCGRNISATHGVGRFSRKERFWFKGW